MIEFKKYENETNQKRIEIIFSSKFQILNRHHILETPFFSSIIFIYHCICAASPGHLV